MERSWDTGEHFTREQAAVFLALQPQTLAAWTSRGEGPPYIKVGRSVRYRKSDIEAWLESRTIRPGAGVEV